MQNNKVYIIEALLTAVARLVFISFLLQLWSPESFVSCWRWTSIWWAASAGTSPWSCPSADLGTWSVAPSRPGVFHSLFPFLPTTRSPPSAFPENSKQPVAHMSPFSLSLNLFGPSPQIATWSGLDRDRGSEEEECSTQTLTSQRTHLSLHLSEMVAWLWNEILFTLNLQCHSLQLNNTDWKVSFGTFYSGKISSRNM